MNANAKRALSSVSRRDRTALAETIASDLAERLSDAIGAEVAVDNPNDGDDLWVEVCRLMTRMVKPPLPAVDHPMTVDEARGIVIADVRMSYGPDEMTDAECIEHVRNTLSVHDLDTDDLRTWQAYLLILAGYPAS